MEASRVNEIMENITEDENLCVIRNALENFGEAQEHTIDFSLCGICRDEVRKILEIAEQRGKVKLKIEDEAGVSHLKIIG